MAKTLFGGGESYVLSSTTIAWKQLINFRPSFAIMLLAEPGLRGQVLDIGCRRSCRRFLLNFARNANRWMGSIPIRRSCGIPHCDSGGTPPLEEGGGAERPI